MSHQKQAPHQEPLQKQQSGKITMLPVVETKLGRFLHVLACPCCEWFRKPVHIGTHGIFAMPYSCCPKCGSKNIKETIGQYEYTETIEKHIFCCNKVRKEIVGFKKREGV